MVFRFLIYSNSGGAEGEILFLRSKNKQKKIDTWVGASRALLERQMTTIIYLDSYFARRFLFFSCVSRHESMSRVGSQPKLGMRNEKFYSILNFHFIINRGSIE